MIDPAKTLYYNLTIQCSLDGFCFVVHHQEENKIIDIELYQTSESADESVIMEALEKALFKKGLLGKTFHSVRYLATNTYHTLVPQALFDEKEREAYLRFNHALPQGYKLFHEPLRNMDAVNVFALPEKQVEHLRNTWHDLDITHQTTLFIDSILKEEPYDSDTNAFVNVSSHAFDLAVVRQGQLSFFNSFKFNTKDDFIYFLMFSLEQQELADKDIPVYFSGLVSNNSEIIRLSERYLRKIRFLRPNASVNVDLSLSNTPFQYYYLPYKSFSCES